MPEILQRIGESVTTRNEAAFIFNTLVKAPHHARADNTSYNFTKSLTDAICDTPKYNKGMVFP